MFACSLYNPKTRTIALVVHRVNIKRECRWARQIGKEVFHEEIKIFIIMLGGVKFIQFTTDA